MVSQPWPQSPVVEKDDSDLITTGKLLLRYKDERWYSKSCVITYWQIEIISFAKNNFDGKALGSYKCFENSCFLKKTMFTPLCILLSEIYLSPTKPMSFKMLGFFYNFSKYVFWHLGGEIFGLNTQNAQSACKCSGGKEKIQCLVFLKLFGHFWCQY